MKADDFRFYNVKPDLPDLQAEMAERAARIDRIVDTTMLKFIAKIDGRPADPADGKFGARVELMHSDWKDGFTNFFVWRKHNVLAWKISPASKALVTFKHIYPDDYPEPLAAFIADLNPDGTKAPD